MREKCFGIILALMLIFAGTVGIAVPSGNSSNAAYAYSSENATSYFVSGGEYLGLFSETINYAHKQEKMFVQNPGLPGYGSSLGCGIVAGGNIVPWYNKQYPELIPGHTAGQYFWGNWLWASANAHTAAMNTQLAADMGTVNNGVTINGYLGGLNTYATGKGRSFTSANMMATGGNGNVLNPGYKAALESGQLMTIFLDTFNILGTTSVESFESQGYDNVYMEEYYGGHVMAVYGYREISYLNAQYQMFRQDIYLFVHIGFGGTLGMTRITNFNHGMIDAAYTTHIY